MSCGTLYLFCGKMGAGKTTQSRLLATEHCAALISEDEWLSRLFPEQIHNFDDYRSYAARLKPLIFDHVKNLLETGTNVVLDFPANTKRQRAWFSELAQAAQANSQLVYIQASDDICLNQIAQRRVEQPERAKFDTEAVFQQVTSFFEEPEDGEGFVIQIIEQDWHSSKN
ncbi:MAG: ATP-binding protein [Pseudomonadales bacterium]|nr:ATP-binding protein [Pseudomonadales bacterium]